MYNLLWQAKNVKIPMMIKAFGKAIWLTADFQAEL